MPFVVLPASIPDIAEVYDVYFEAFRDELITEILFPTGVETKAFREAHTSHTLSFWHNSVRQYTLKCVETSSSRIVGMALWDIFWTDMTEEERSMPKVDWLEGKAKDRAEAFIQPFWQKREEIMDGKKHVYCHVVAVHPDFQRRGIGKLLTKWGIEVAHQLKAPLYLESSNAARKMYQDLGFHCLEPGINLGSDVVKEGEDPIEVPVMIKSPLQPIGSAKVL